MLIANPIYDVVFKYLLEDIEIAKELLSTILGVKILGLQVKPQETLVLGETGEIKIFHLDFKAVIELGEGMQKTVLIELQKAKKSHDILRFRKYLGENYTKEEVRKSSTGELESYALEIVTIYLLGFKLEGVEVPVLKVSRKYEDAITQEEVLAKNDFIQKLTHESYTIQIPRLQSSQRTQLEEVLEIFRQENAGEDLHVLHFVKEPKNALVKKIVKRLSKAASNAAIKRGMEAEDSIERLINREMKAQAQVYEEKLQEKDMKLQESEREKDILRKQLDELLKQLNK